MHFQLLKLFTFQSRVPKFSKRLKKLILQLVKGHLKMSPGSRSTTPEISEDEPENQPNLELNCFVWFEYKQAGTTERIK